jgi:hypothetical protein
MDLMTFHHIDIAEFRLFHRELGTFLTCNAQGPLLNSLNRRVWTTKPAVPLQDRTFRCLGSILDEPVWDHTIFHYQITTAIRGILNFSPYPMATHWRFRLLKIDWGQVTEQLAVVSCQTLQIPPFRICIAPSGCWQSSPWTLMTDDKVALPLLNLNLPSRKNYQ